MADINLKDEVANPGEDKAIDLSLMSQVDRKLYDSLDAKGRAEYNGFGGGARVGHSYDSPTRVARPGDHLTECNGCVISLQKDRESNMFSGTGGTENTHAAAIDLVAGPMGYLGRSHTKKNKKVFVDPSFTRDAARVYISQKADVDKYLNLTEGILTEKCCCPKSRRGPYRRPRKHKTSNQDRCRKFSRRRPQRRIYWRLWHTIGSDER